MNKKIRWITETAIMLALLVTLQMLTKPMGQLVTGSCVNAVLAVSALVGGLGCGLTVALISPVLAFLLNIAPQILTVPAIMVGNTVFVVLLSLLADKSGKRIVKIERLVIVVCRGQILEYTCHLCLKCRFCARQICARIGVVWRDVDYRVIYR